MRIILFFIIFLLNGCAIRSLDSINIIDNIPQTAMSYTNSSDIKVSNVDYDFKDEYLQKYFSMWEDSFNPPNSKEIFWGLNDKNGFDESKKSINMNFFSNIIENMQVESYPSMKQKAVMVKNSNIRVLPTIKPRFSTINGYPFDRWQNSSIYAFSPVLILHQSKDKEWVLIQASFAAGWVKSDEVAKLSDKDAKKMLEAKDYLVPIKDKIPLYYKNTFLTKASIGMIYEKQKDSIIGYKRDLNGNAIRIRIKYDKDDFAPFPLPQSNINIAKVADSIANENYGWGGMYGNRDCSSFIRDIFANFGIFLPRNSIAQVNYGKITKYSKYMLLPESNEEKIKFINKFAVPFRTIIHLKGHIMLYIGSLNGTPIVMHQVWGVSDKDGGEILSKVSITTLTPIINKVDYEIQNPKSLLERIDSMNVIF